MGKGNGRVKVERGVPLPTAHKAHRYPWREMKIGDSFVVAANEIQNPIANLHSTARNARVKCAVRKQPDGSYRAWRIA